jgi:hypothetical protein
VPPAGRRWQRIIISGRLRQVLQHVVGGRQHLGIHLVGALGGDHVDHLFDHLHVRAFQRALFQLAEGAVAGTAFVRGAAGGGFLEQVLAQRLQAGRIDEGGQRQLAQFGRRGLARDGGADHAVFADGDRWHCSAP